MLMQCGVAERTMNIVRVSGFNTHGSTTYSMDMYSAWWRCWSDKPSAELLEDTAWESDG